MFNVKHAAFGAKGDGVTNDTAAILAALAALRATPDLGELYFPAGMYLFSSTLDFSDIPLVRGAGRSATILKPTAALAFGADAILFNEAAIPKCALRDFTLDGASTVNTSIVGIHLASGENLRLHDVGVQNFATANSIGIRLDDVIFPRFVECFAGSNFINIDVGTNASASFPTMVRFFNCETRSGVVGLKIGQAFNALWLGGKVESNTQEGVISRPSTGQVVQDVTIQDAYFEHNNSDVSTQYETFFDNSAGGSIGNVALRGCRFNSGPGHVRAAYFNNVQGWLLDGVDRLGSAGAFLVEGPLGYGWVEHWLSGNGDIDSTIDDTATHQAQHSDRWPPFTPALTGGGTLAVSAVVATKASFHRYGKKAVLDLNVSFTIATSNSTNVNLTLPFGVAIWKEMFVPCLVSEGGGALQAGIAHLIPSAPGTTVTFSKLTGTNWANGSGNAIHAQLVVETT